MKPERKACSVDGVKKCMKKCLEINVACDKCGKTFMRQVCLLFHVKKMHERINAHTCTQCNAGFKCYFKYKMHVEQQHLDCGVDDEDSRLIQTRSKSLTKRQLQDTSTFLSRLCADEDRSINSDDDSNHLVGDTYCNDNTNNSEGENTSSVEESSKNKRQYVRKENATCSICSVQCKTTLSLLRHWKQEHTTEEAESDPKYYKFNDMHTCKICDEFYSNVRTLKKHKKDVHGIIEYKKSNFFTEEEEEQLKEAEQILANSGFKTYKCTFCDMKIECGRRYLTHLAKHKGLLPFCCELCGKTFASPGSLRMHIKVIHERVKDHKCEFCGKEFGDRTNMLTHQSSLHTRDRKYICKICGLSFLSNNSLYYHRRAHNNYKPYQCEECKTNYARKQQLEEHVNRHHRTEKSFVCEICGKAFAVSNSLRIHMVTHSETRPHKCSMCERALKRRKYLTSHIESHHSLNKELYTAMLQ